MRNLDKYKSQADLSEEELEAITQRLVEEKFDREKKGMWATQLAEAYQVKRSVSMRRRRRWLYPAIAIAASLLIAVVAIPLWQSFQSAPKKLLAEYTIKNPFPNHLIRKGENDIIALRIQATEAYNQANYRSAIIDYEQLTNSNEATLEDHFYLGLSQLYEKQNRDAVQTLEVAKAKSEAEERFEQEINWFLALAYWQNEQTIKAKAILNNIVEQQSWKAKEAERLLEQLE